MSISGSFSQLLGIYQPAPADHVGTARAIQQLARALRSLGLSVPLLLETNYSGATTTYIWNDNCPRSFRLFECHVIAFGSAASNAQVFNDANAITDNMAVSATNGVVTRAGTIDASYYQVNKAGTVSIVSTGAGAGIVRTLWLPVA